MNPGAENNRLANFISTGGTKEQPGSISCFLDAHQPRRTEAEDRKGVPWLSPLLSDLLCPLLFLSLSLQDLPSEPEQWQRKIETELWVS